MGAGSGSGKGGAGGVPPVLPNQPTSGKGGSNGIPPAQPQQPAMGKGGSNGIPPAQPNQPTLGNQLIPQQPMGKGGAMPQQPAMGKGGSTPQPYQPTRADYDRMMASIRFAPGANIPTYEEWSASRAANGKGGAQSQQPTSTSGTIGLGQFLADNPTFANNLFGLVNRNFLGGSGAQPMGPRGVSPQSVDDKPRPTFAQQMQQPMGKGGAMPQQPRGIIGNTRADYDRMMATAKFAPGTAPTYEEWSASRAANGKGGAQPQQPIQPPVAPVSQGITGLPNIPRGSARPRNRRLMSPAPRRNFRPLTRRGGTR